MIEKGERRENEGNKKYEAGHTISPHQYVKHDEVEHTLE